MTFSIQLKDAEKGQIKIWLDYLRSLEFVQTIKEKEDVKPYLLVNSIKELYPNQWDLLADSKAEGIKILGGRVILAMPDKHQLALNGRDLVTQYANVRHFYTGEWPRHRHIGLMVRQKNPPAHEEI